MKKLILAGIIFMALVSIVQASPADMNISGSLEETHQSENIGFVESQDIAEQDCIIIDDGIHDIRTSWALSEEKKYIDLSRMKSGTASRSISTITAASYTLSFDMAGNPECPPDEKVLMVYWGDQPAYGPYSYSATKPGGWVTITLDDLPGKDGATELTFDDVSDPSSACGAALDNISVTSKVLVPVPEFPNMALPAGLIIGFIGSVIYVRNTREQ